jgi:hypothetical protein
MIWLMTVVSEVTPLTMSARSGHVNIEGSGLPAARLYNTPVGGKWRLEIEPEGVDQLKGVIPERGPEVTEPVQSIIPELQGRHPRLLFTSDDIAELNEFRNTSDGRGFCNIVRSYRNTSLHPGNTKFQTNANEAQLKGFWRMRTKAVYYALTGDITCRDELIE